MDMHANTLLMVMHTHTPTNRPIATVYQCPIPLPRSGLIMISADWEAVHLDHSMMVALGSGFLLAKVYGAQRAVAGLRGSIYGGSGIRRWRGESGRGSGIGPPP